MVLAPVAAITLAAFSFWGDDESSKPLPEQMYDHMIDERRQEISQENMKRMIEFQQSLDDFNAQIAQDRANYWALYPDKPGFADAKKKFSDDLFAKDFFYMQPKDMRFLAGIGDKRIDGGIPAYAIVEYNNWLRAIKEETIGKGTIDDLSVTQVFEAQMKIPKAITDNQKLYRLYTVERDWAEFDAAHREPAGCDAPPLYGAMLLMRYERRSPQDAAQEYADMENAIGKAKLQAALRKVHDLPKDKHNNLTDEQITQLGLFPTGAAYITGPSGTKIEQYDALAPPGMNPVGQNDPLAVAVALATFDDPRTYVLNYMAKVSPGLALPNAPESSEYSTSYLRYRWEGAPKWWNACEAAFGSKAVAEVAAKVHGARKLLGQEALANPREINAQNSNPAFAFQSALTTGDPKGYVRLLLFSDKPGSSSGDLDSAYAGLIGKYPEATMLTVSARMIANLRSGYNTYSTKDLLDMLSGAKPTPAAPVAETPSPAASVPVVPVNPKYISWAPCPAGTKVEYLMSDWLQLHKQVQFDIGPFGPYLHERWTLRSVDPTVINFWLTQWSRGAPEDRDDYVHAGAADAINPANPTATGAETLVINGKELRCHWESEVSGTLTKREVRTVWISSQVPGLLVRELTQTLAGPLPYGTSYRERLVVAFDPTPSAAKPIPSPDEKDVPSGLLSVTSPSLGGTSIEPAALAVADTSLGDAPAFVTQDQLDQEELATRAEGYTQEKLNQITVGTSMRDVISILGHSNFKKDASIQSWDTRFTAHFDKGPIEVQIDFVDRKVARIRGSFDPPVSAENAPLAVGTPDSAGDPTRRPVEEAATSASWLAEAGMRGPGYWPVRNIQGSVALIGTPLYQLCGKSTGVAEEDERIVQDYQLTPPNQPYLAREFELRRQTLRKLLNIAGPPLLSKSLIRSIRIDCLTLENGHNRHFGSSPVKTPGSLSAP